MPKGEDGYTKYGVKHARGGATFCTPVSSFILKRPVYVSDLVQYLHTRLQMTFVYPLPNES